MRYWNGSWELLQAYCTVHEMDTKARKNIVMKVYSFMQYMLFTTGVFLADIIGKYEKKYYWQMSEGFTD